MAEVLFPPEGWLPTQLDLMTNLGHEIDQAVADRLRQGGAVGKHAAWDFCGWAWFADGRWHELVQVYKQNMGTYSADTLEELMKIVNDEYGWK